MCNHHTVVSLGLYHPSVSSASCCISKTRHCCYGNKHRFKTVSIFIPVWFVGARTIGFCGLLEQSVHKLKSTCSSLLMRSWTDFMHWQHICMVGVPSESTCQPIFVIYLCAKSAVGTGMGSSRVCLFILLYYWWRWWTAAVCHEDAWRHF